jgi:hypothetical protein
MLDLTRLENLEFRAVELLAKAMPAASRQKLSAALDSLRATKRRLLARNPSVLRKLRADPAPQDKPNAPMPDAELKPATRIFHNAAMAGMRLLHGARKFDVSPAGHCEIAAGDHHGAALLRSRHFVELVQTDRFGKSATVDLVQMFRPSRLPLIGENDDFFRAMHRRADQAPAELRLENLDGPGPAPTHCRSAAEFRRSYFGERS